MKRSQLSRMPYKIQNLFNYLNQGRSHYLALHLITNGLKMNIMLKKSLLFLTISMSLGVLVGCAKDTNFTKEVRGTDDYLSAPQPKELAIPPSVALPPQNADFEVPRPAVEGAVGLAIDITPPNIGLTSVADQSQAQTSQENFTADLYQSNITVNSSKDDTNLPIILIDTDFVNTWQLVSSKLKQAGFDILEQNQTTGLIKVDFSGVSDELLAEVGIVSFELPDNVYLIQVGDLNNKTSIQFRDEKNVYITQSQNDQLGLVLQNILNK